MQRLIRKEIEGVYLERINKWKERKTMNYGVNWTMDEEEKHYKKSSVIETDLRPILQCMYIHKKMHKLMDLTKSFQEDRRAQFNLLTVQKLNLMNREEFKSLFYDLVGFFVVERQLFFQALELRSLNETGTLFAILVDKIVNEMYIQIEESNYQSKKDLEHINNLLIAATMMFKKMGYHVHKLDDLTNAITTFIESPQE